MSFLTNPVFEATLAAPGRVLRAQASIREQMSSLDTLPPNSIKNILVPVSNSPNSSTELFASYTGGLVSVPISRCSLEEFPSYIDPSTLVVLIGSNLQFDLAAEFVDNCTAVGANIISLVDRPTASGAYHSHERSAASLVLNRQQPWGALGQIEELAAGIEVLRAYGVLNTDVGSAGAFEESLAETVESLAKPTGLANTLASLIERTIPFFVGSGPYGGAMADVWRGCYNMTTRAPAFSSTLAEADGVGMHGWGQHGDVTRQVLTTVVLETSSEADLRSAERSYRYLDAIAEFTGALERVIISNKSPEVRFFGLLILGQLVALWRADQEGLVPTGETSYRM